MAARRLHGLVYLTIFLCVLSITICGLALGTNYWFKSVAAPPVDSNSLLHMEVSYGLFNGKKVKYLGDEEVTNYNLKVICQGSDNKCMYSCGSSSSQRKKDLSDIISSGTADVLICRGAEVVTRTDTADRANKTGEWKAEGDESAEAVFLNFALYLITIVFVALGIAFSSLAGALALYNTYRTPIQPILSVLGLYVWNGISASCIAFAMIMWGIAFATSLNKNAAIGETLDHSFDSNGNGSLGWSFWILLVACFSSLANIGILKYRSWKIIQMEAKNVIVMNTKLDSGDILLF